jgi:hypothetical protein
MVETLAGRSTRCAHCGKLVVVAASAPVGQPMFVDEGTVPATAEPAQGFAVFSATAAMQAERRHNNWQKIVARIRVTLLVGAVVGMTAGAALGGGWDASAEVLGARAIGAFLGILFGLSLGVVYGLMASTNPRLLAQAHTVEMLNELGDGDRVPDVFTLVGLAFGLMRSQKSWRLDAGDFILLGMAAGALLGAVVGAELVQVGLDMGRPSWLTALTAAAGGLAGFLLMLAVVYFVWRPWRRLSGSKA